MLLQHFFPLSFYVNEERLWSSKFFMTLMPCYLTGSETQRIQAEDYIKLPGGKHGISLLVFPVSLLQQIFISYSLDLKMLIASCPKELRLLNYYPLIVIFHKFVLATSSKHPL